MKCYSIILMLTIYLFICGSIMHVNEPGLYKDVVRPLLTFPAYCCRVAEFCDTECFEANWDHLLFYTIGEKTSE